jgi:tyrosine decarboxylase / aspartate 1-decarboxylase
VLKLEYTSVPPTPRPNEPDALEPNCAKGDVGTVVVTLGTTAIGAVDPLDQILALRERTASEFMWMRPMAAISG